MASKDKLSLFLGTQEEGFTLKPPKMMQAESNGSSKQEHTEGGHPRIKKVNKKGTTFVFIVTISWVTIIKCILFSEMFLWKETALWAWSVFHSLAELLWMKLKVSAILSGKAQRLLHGSISNSLTGTHTNTLTRRMQNEAAAQSTNNLPDRLRDKKNKKQTKRKDSYYVRFEGNSSNYS